MEPFPIVLRLVDPCAVPREKRTNVFLVLLWWFSEAVLLCPHVQSYGEFDFWIQWAEYVLLLFCFSLVVEFLCPSTKPYGKVDIYTIHFCYSLFGFSSHSRIFHSYGDVTISFFESVLKCKAIQIQILLSKVRSSTVISNVNKCTRICQSYFFSTLHCKI